MTSLTSLEGYVADGTGIVRSSLAGNTIPPPAIVISAGVSGVSLMSSLAQPKNALPITANDTVTFSSPTSFISFGVTGAVSVAAIYVDMVGGQKNVPVFLPSGMYPMCVTRVYSTGTTAVNIVGWWNT